MKILVLGTSRSGFDPRTARLMRSLAEAGHSVTFASPRAEDARFGSVVIRLMQIDTRWPRSGGRLSSIVRRMNLSSVRRMLVRSRMRAIAEATVPDVVYATTRRIAEDVDRLGPPIAVLDGSSAGITHDIATMPPSNIADDGLPPWMSRPMSTPNPGRHSGKSVVLCYQPTDTTPARYLRAALERAGVSVEHRYPTVDLADVPRDVSGVVFVESPYPALEVRGTTAVPVVYWTHHGEHHMYQNLRLAHRYRADAVLLAHSWHLGHRFAVPTFRFPFGVPTEMVGVQAPWEERPIEVAMVGAGFDGDGERYAVRRSLSKKFTDRYGPDRTVFTAGVTPESVFFTYARAKVVVDEGGSLHRPVTMRVFEATGSGAALATDLAPGIEQLFDLESELVALDPQDPLAVVRTESVMRAIAAAGNARALGTHTYDHRVDELFEILSKVKKRPIAVLRQPPPRVRLASRFAEIDSIACADSERDVWASTSYVVWSHAEIRDRQVMVDVVVIDDDHASAADLIGLAHRHLICSAETASSVRRMLGTHGRHFVESSLEGSTVFDFEVPGYILRDSP